MGARGDVGDLVDVVCGSVGAAVPGADVAADSEAVPGDPGDGPALSDGLLHPPDSSTHMAAAATVRRDPLLVMHPWQPGSPVLASLPAPSS
ncbi:hypothetical protein [Haloactinopolyspora alba]|uniref:hypothetical protein n=1 Tax=Haloactinopolyspora alba TaxID=648780 RepID=UPI00197A7EC7|nr:hypothetical protein [Haloactinopolyspora alba]